MRHKTLHSIILIFLILTSGCSNLDKLIYCSKLDQGNYFTYEDISKLHVGMTQQQVSRILGTPTMFDLFGANTWFYVFHKQLGRKYMIQKNLTLYFNSKNTLTTIDFAIIKR